jgi:hypothetical protein
MVGRPVALIDTTLSLDPNGVARQILSEAGVLDIPMGWKLSVFVPLASMIFQPDAVAACFCITVVPCATIHPFSHPSSVHVAPSLEAQRFTTALRFNASPLASNVLATRSLEYDPSLTFSMLASKLGIAIPSKTAKIATVIINSASVNPYECDMRDRLVL